MSLMLLSLLLMALSIGAHEDVDPALQSNVHTKNYVWVEAPMRARLLELYQAGADALWSPTAHTVMAQLRTDKPVVEQHTCAQVIQEIITIARQHAIGSECAIAELEAYEQVVLTGGAALPLTQVAQLQTARTVSDA